MRSTIIVMCGLLLVVCRSGICAKRSGHHYGIGDDQAGAVIPNAPIEVTNINTGAVHKVQSSSTGNYTFSQLPVGKYQDGHLGAGFKQFVRTGITVLVAQTLRIDISLDGRTPSARLSR